MSPCRRLLITAFAAALTGCGGGGTEPPGAPEHLLLMSGDAQTGSVGAQLPQPLTVKVTDSKGRGVPGVPVDFSVSSLGGSVTPTSASTNADGVASSRWTLGTFVNSSMRVTAQVLDRGAGTLSNAVFFTATPTAGPTGRIVADGGDGQNAVEGTPLPNPIFVLVTDIYGNPKPNVPVTFSVSFGGGSVAPPTVMTGDNGRASTIWTMGSSGQAQRATASIAGFAAVTFSAIATH